MKPNAMVMPSVSMNIAWLALPTLQHDNPDKPPDPDDEPVLPPDRKPRPVKEPPRRRDVPEPPEIEEPDPPKRKRRALANTRTGSTREHTNAETRGAGSTLR